MSGGIRGKDFIVFGLQPWDYELGSNCKNIAMEFARDNRVLYVNQPIERYSLIRFRTDKKIQNRLESIRKGKRVLEKEQSNLWAFNPRVILESINWVPAGPLYRSFNRMNAKRLARQMAWAAKELGFTNPVLFIDNDFLKGVFLNDYLKADMMIYYIRDFLLSHEYFIKHGKKIEPELMSKSDIVVANSRYLANYARNYNERSYDIGQGCELDGYIREHYERPADLQGISSPVIGYCGALLETRLNIHLLEELGARRPDWNLVLVGPEDKAFQASSLHKLKNVHFLGPKPAASLPAYVHYFDVCMNPQILNQMTIGNYPRKIDEYLAAGKPVVATETEAMEMFRPYCVLATDTQGYIDGIETILSSGPDAAAKQKRRQFALSHTWEASVQGIYDAMRALDQSNTGNGKR